MSWYDQIQVERLANTDDDLFAVNAARVSFSVWKDTFEAKDQKLLTYLAQHEHTSPFRHVRVTLVFDKLPFSVFNLTPFDNAGMVFDKHEGEFRVRHSIFGWVNLLQSDKLSLAYRARVIALLHKLYPGCMEAFGIKAIPGTEHTLDIYSGIVRVFEGEEHNPWFQDFSFRCTAPVTIARHLVKHQVMLSWNEVSRRYVSDTPELFEQEFRVRPENSIKQGSGEACESFFGRSPLAQQEYHLGWYNRCIEKGLAPETVRGYLPQNMLTTWIWTGPKPAFEHMLRLRMGEGAQKEASVFAAKLQAAMD